MRQGTELEYCCGEDTLQAKINLYVSVGVFIDTGINVLFFE